MSVLFFHILLNVHPNIMIVFFTNLMYRIFILIQLLYFSICFEHYEGTIVLLQNLVSLLSLGDCSDHR